MDDFNKKILLSLSTNWSFREIINSVKWINYAMRWIADLVYNNEERQTTSYKKIHVVVYTSTLLLLLSDLFSSTLMDLSQF